MDHVFSVQAMVRGYHYYKLKLSGKVGAIDGQVLSCEREVARYVRNPGIRNHNNYVLR